MVKNPLQCKRPSFDPWVGKIPWRRKWQPTPVFLPGKSHGQRSLAGYRLWDSKELGTTEQLTHILHTRFFGIQTNWGEDKAGVTGSEDRIPECVPRSLEGSATFLSYLVFLFISVVFLL